MEHIGKADTTDTVDLFEEFRSAISGLLNYGIVTFLAKILGVGKITQFSSIYILKCLYKLITKCLTLILEKITDKLILMNKSSFMKGRNIMNGVMDLHEVLRDTKTENIT